MDSTRPQTNETKPRTLQRFLLWIAALCGVLIGSGSAFLVLVYGTEIFQISPQWALTVSFAVLFLIFSEIYILTKIRLSLIDDPDKHSWPELKRIIQSSPSPVLITDSSGSALI